MSVREGLSCMRKSINFKHSELRGSHRALGQHDQFRGDRGPVLSELELRVLVEVGFESLLPDQFS